MNGHCSFVVVGAGPAGMAAAIAAAAHGVEVTVFDEQSRPGGQIYRQVDSSPLGDATILGDDYRRGAALVEAFKCAQVAYRPSSAVWYLDERRELGVLGNGVNRFLRAAHVLLAAGAQERPMPVPGWQLPGVMTAGAAQILLKSAALVPRSKPVLAGSGPLLVLLAWQYLRAGVAIRAVLDTTPRGNYARALRYLPRALAGHGYLRKGARLLAAIRAAGVPVYRGVSALRILGEDAVEAVSFHTARSAQARIETATVLLHQGITPGLHLPMAAGCRTAWSERQHTWWVPTDEWGQSSVAGIMLAGDGARIGGALSAELQGRLCGLYVAHALGQLARGRLDRLAAPLRRALRRDLAVRPFLDELYRPPREYLVPGDDTLVCRCEEVTAAEVRRVAALGCTGPNQVKAFTRCGMGPCQGRQCGDSVAALIADVHGLSIEQVGQYRARPPVKPVTLGQLAADP